MGQYESRRSSLRAQLKSRELEVEKLTSKDHVTVPEWSLPRRFETLLSMSDGIWQGPSEGGRMDRVGQGQRPPYPWPTILLYTSPEKCTISYVKSL